MNHLPTTIDDASERSLLGARLAGRYRLERILGEGGMGVVYEAVEEELGRRVALKLIAGSVSQGALARLRQEAEATARLGSPHIVRVTDFQSNPGEPPFLVMELLSGCSLRALLAAEGTISWQRAVRLGVQVLAALEAAHAAQIIHRDIKPDNVFVFASTAVQDMVKVLDFGVAKVIADDAKGMTAPGALLGTLAYMAPEVARGDTIDGRADLYAVAVTLYEAVAGRRPIAGADPAALFAAITSAAPMPLEHLRPDVPAAFASVVMKGLAKSPDARCQHASEMSAALAACLSEPGVAPTFAPGVAPTFAPGVAPMFAPGGAPTFAPGGAPTSAPTVAPTFAPGVIARSTASPAATARYMAPPLPGVRPMEAPFASPATGAAPQTTRAPAPPRSRAWWLVPVVGICLIAAITLVLVVSTVRRAWLPPAAAASSTGTTAATATVVTAFLVPDPPPPGATRPPPGAANSLQRVTEASIRARLRAAGFTIVEEESSKDASTVVRTFKIRRGAQHGGVTLYKYSGPVAANLADLTEDASRNTAHAAVVRDETTVLLAVLEPSGAQQVLDAVRR